MRFVVAMVWSSCLCCLPAYADGAPRLVGWAALPQQTRIRGPSSGHFIRAANGVSPPFVEGQPVPGWSGLVCNADGSFVALPDNGYGTKGNSADYLLGFYIVRPTFKNHGDGTTTPGLVREGRFVALRDPKRLLANGRGVDLTLTADRATYYRGDGAGTDSGIAVDPRIRRRRLLTGYDFDVESVARARDGSYWIGEEFGPFLLHFAADGTLLEEPLPHPSLKSPSHPEVLLGRAAATLASSRGFEALAFDGAKEFLYAAPEAAPTVDSLRAVPGDERVIAIDEIDPRAGYTGRSFKYRKDDAALLIGDMTNLGGRTFALIERDSLYGANAAVKRVYLFDLDRTDAAGVLHKTLLVDLLDVADPEDIGGPLPRVAADRFDLPFDSIEALCAVDASTLAIAIDSNFPNEDAREPGRPDDSEMIELRFDRPLIRLR
jgi:hypothetical protein